MAQRLVLCFANGRSQANRIVGHLINGGFAENSVSILFADKRDLEKISGQKHAGAARTARAGIAALLGGAFVWLNGSGVLTVPDLGPLIIAGAPIAAVLGRLKQHGIAPALVEMGLSFSDAAIFEGRIREGNILISVNVTGSMEAIAASRIIRAIGIEDVTDTANPSIGSSSITGGNWAGAGWEFGPAY